MSERPEGSQVPEFLQPLYKERHTHEAIRIAARLIQETAATDQKKLLSEPAFVKIVRSMLAGVDECREQHTFEILGAFSPEIRESAKEIIINTAS